MKLLTEEVDWPALDLAALHTGDRIPPPRGDRGGLRNPRLIIDIFVTRFDGVAKQACAGDRQEESEPSTAQGGDTGGEFRSG